MPIRAKNLTPFLFATTVTSRRPPQPEVTVVVKGTYRLVADGVMEAVTDASDGLPLSGDLFAEVDDDDRAGECLHASDFADFKLNAEVLLVGSAFAPRGEEVTELPVLLSVGAWKKMLRVIGPRVWTRGLTRSFSEPKPFSTMRLDWSNAFGGKDSPHNPAGKGWGTDELPTVELAGDILSSPSNRPLPATFAPVSPYWRARAGKLGSDYGGSYKKERYPFYARDFDWSYFSAALPDQQLEGYLRGDEEVTLQNLHPEVPVLRTRLPAVRPRVFLKDDRGEVHRVKLSLDTVTFDTDRGLCALTWRGLAEVREVDLDDLVSALVASEPLESAPLPDEHYLPILQAFEEDPAGLEDAVPEDLRDLFFGRSAEAAEPSDASAGGAEATGEVEGESDAEGEGAGEADGESEGDAEGTAAATAQATEGAPDPLSDFLDARLGKVAKAERDELRGPLAHAMAQEGMREKVEERLAENAAAEGDEPPIPPTLKPGTFPELHLRRKMRLVLAQAASLREQLVGVEVPEEELAKLDALERVPHDPAWTKLDPDYTPPTEPLSTDEPGPGRDLSERDFTGQDLSGMDLSGANLEQAVLTRTNLSGANLSGANLRGAVLYRAGLSGANLTRANLTRANLAKAALDGADLSEATLEQTYFEEANLVGATLRRATGEYTMFMHAKLGKASVCGAKLAFSDFTEASLEEADFANSELTNATFTDSHANGASFDDAKLDEGRLQRAELRGARLEGVRAARANFSGAHLEGADLSFSVLRGAHFTKAFAAEARFFGADLREARLYRAGLERAVFERANLFAAELGKSRLDGTSFRGASLYDARLLGAGGKGTDFLDAVLHRSTLER